MCYISHVDIKLVKFAGVFVFGGLAAVGAYLPSPWSTIIHAVCTPVLLLLGASIKSGGGFKELLDWLKAGGAKQLEDAAKNEGPTPKQ